MATQKTPLGLVLPIRTGKGGFFDQAYDTFTQKRMNIINLLRTRIGERRMQPMFGSRLWNTVFEQNVEILPEIITNIVKEDIGRWVEGVTVKNVSIKTPETSESFDNKDIYRLYVSVSFIVDVTQEEGTVDIIINGGKI
jgi:phage baseplate assembly protein W